MAPIVYLGLAIAGGFALLKRSDSSPPVAATTDAALIDPSEKMSPNAEVARRAIVAAMHFNSLSLYENTAIAIESQLKMPKTAANVRTWAQMAKSGGLTVAGDDDEVGGTHGYGDYDEVGAAKRVVKKLYAKHTAAKPKPKARPKPKAKPLAKARKRPSSSARPAARVPPALNAPTPEASPATTTTPEAPTATPAAAAAPIAVESHPAEPATPAAVLALASSPAAPVSLSSWSGPSDDGDGYDDAEADDDAGDDEDEVGATRSRKKLPDWLRFSATQSMLAGDPKLIEATAKVMRRMGYHEHAAVHLRALHSKGNDRARI